MFIEEFWLDIWAVRSRKLVMGIKNNKQIFQATRERTEKSEHGGKIEERRGENLDPAIYIMH